MISAAESRLRSSVGPMAPFRDGYQTGSGGNNPLHYAQHATATCCRKCIAEWHGIPRGVELTAVQIDYFTRLLMLYIEERLPDLTEGGEYVPPIREGGSGN